MRHGVQLANKQILQREENGVHMKKLTFSKVDSVAMCILAASASMGAYGVLKVLEAEGKRRNAGNL